MSVWNESPTQSLAEAILFAPAWVRVGITRPQPHRLSQLGLITQS
ncbi:DUF6771 family protein [Sphingomonas sp. NIBR02145]